MMVGIDQTGILRLASLNPGCSGLRMVERHGHDGETAFSRGAPEVVKQGLPHGQVSATPSPG